MNSILHTMEYYFMWILLQLSVATVNTKIENGRRKYKTSKKKINKCLLEVKRYKIRATVASRKGIISMCWNNTKKIFFFCYKYKVNRKSRYSYISGFSVIFFRITKFSFSIKRKLWMSSHGEIYYSSLVFLLKPKSMKHWIPYWTNYSEKPISFVVLFCGGFSRKLLSVRIGSKINKKFIKET